MSPPSSTRSASASPDLQGRVPVPGQDAGGLRVDRALVKVVEGDGDRDRRRCSRWRRARRSLLVAACIKRAVRNMLGRDFETGHLTNDKPGQTFDDWKKEAQK